MFRKLVSIGIGLLGSWQVSAQVIDTVCVSEQDIRYSVTDHPGSTYTWWVTGGTITNGNGTSTVRVNWGNQPGLYTLKVLEENFLHCYGDTVKALIRVLYKAEPSLVGPHEACIGESILLQASGGTDYEWHNGAKTSSQWFRITNDTVAQVIIRNPFCHTVEDTLSIPIIARPNPIAALTVNTDYATPLKPVGFTFTGQGANTVEWEFEGANPSGSSAWKPWVTYEEEGTYHVFVTATNGYGCIDTAGLWVTISPDEQLYIPNAFSPNGDMNNDVFEVKGAGISTYQLIIYNRWGEKIFSSDSMHKSWDGRYMGNESSEGVYSYQIFARGKSGKLFNRTGQITLLK